MKMTKLVILIVMIAVALFLVLPNLSWAAEDGAAIYKAKCAACHGADLAGKPAAKIPSLVSDDAKKSFRRRSHRYDRQRRQGQESHACFRQQRRDPGPSEDGRVLHPRSAKEVVQCSDSRNRCSEWRIRAAEQATALPCEGE